MITGEPIDLEALRCAVRDPRHGGEAIFVGAVRDHHEGRGVEAVTYEAFVPLAERELARIAREAEERCGARVACAHRLGRLAVGEVSVAVAATSPHRAAAFEACRLVIEEIKARLPVWKKEHYADGQAAWLEGCALRGCR